jgi:cyclic pyranopterin phosphate synthase
VTADFTHFDEKGAARMVDVTQKTDTARRAVAGGYVEMKPATLELIRSGGVAKGDVLGVARVAGIMGAKRTPELIPMCHPLNVSSAAVDFEFDETHRRILIRAVVQLSGQTGVEMEALTAVSVAALTIYDMCKAVDKDMIIGGIELLEKSGGKSGTFKRK